jgi:hypothetical protein
LFENQVVDRLPLTIELLLQSGLGKTVKYISEHPPTTGEFLHISFNLFYFLFVWFFVGCFFRWKQCACSRGRWSAVSSTYRQERIDIERWREGASHGPWRIRTIRNTEKGDDSMGLVIVILFTLIKKRNSLYPETNHVTPLLRANPETNPSRN